MPARVQVADHVGERAAVARQHVVHVLLRGGVGGHRLHLAVSPISALSDVGRALGHEPALVDDPHAVGELRRPPRGTGW